MNTAVVGTDLSPIQPAYVPVNCPFLIDDANQPWLESFHARFDYVHTRALGMGIRSWDLFVERARDALKPEGWLELQEFHFPLSCDDGTVRPDSTIAK